MKHLLFLALLSLHPLLACAQQALQDILNTYRDSLDGYGMVALVDNGSQIKTAAIGQASAHEPMQADHRFCIGSATKMYTAVLVLKLHEKKLLSMEDSLGQFFPGHRYLDPGITVRQLLNHTSGLPDVIDASLANAALLHPYADYSDAALLARIDTSLFPKGRQYAYSNTNYFLLRRIIEIAADKPWPAVLEEEIIGPLKLQNTFPYHSRTIAHLAHPIIGGQDLHRYPRLGMNAISVGLGNITSDLRDVNTFLRALFIDQTLLSAESLRQMTGFSTFGSTRVGLGAFEAPCGTRRLRGHTGRTISYISIAYADTDTGTTFVLLTNNANDPWIDVVLEELCGEGW